MEKELFPVRIKYQDQEEVIISEIPEEKWPKEIRENSFFTRLICSLSGVGKSRVAVMDGICVILEKRARTIEWAKIAKEWKVVYVFLEDLEKGR